MGDNSYVLYLFHWPILMVIMRIIKPWYIVSTLVFIASVIATYIFEKIYKRIKEKINGGMKRDSTV